MGDILNYAKRLAKEGKAKEIKEDYSKLYTPKKEKLKPMEIKYIPLLGTWPKTDLSKNIREEAKKRIENAKRI